MLGNCTLMINIYLFVQGGKNPRALPQIPGKVHFFPRQNKSRRHDHCRLDWEVFGPGSRRDKSFLSTHLVCDFCEWNEIKVFQRYLAFEKFNNTIAQPQLRINTVEAAGTTTSTCVQHSGHCKNKQLVPAKYLWSKHLSKISFQRTRGKMEKKIPRFKCCANDSRCFVWTKGEKNVRWRKIAPKCDKWQKFKRAVINR